MHFIIHGALQVLIACHPTLVQDYLERAIISGEYEHNEAEAAALTVKPTDIVLELGAGLGAVASHVWNSCHPVRYVAFEADHRVRPLLAATLEKNAARGVTVRGEVLTNDLAAIARREMEFFVVKSAFYANSTVKTKKHSYVEPVPALSFPAYLKELSPTVLICDVEGAELDLFGRDGATRREMRDALRSVRAIILEVHPWAIGDQGVATVGRSLHELGFTVLSESDSVILLSR
jgi:FkbM family methyltransferase